MPCRCPDGSHPFACNKKIARGTSADDGHDHVWPEEGQFYVEKCEVFCWFCYVSKGDTEPWKHPWHLRRHVRSVHAGRTHPNLTCSKFWKGSDTGNRKPWREQGITPPMGNRAVPKDSNTPKANMAAKTPNRQRKRQTQKKKRSSAVATPKTNTSSAATTPSPPSLTVDTSSGMPAGQLALPDGFVLTPRSFGMGQAYGMSNNDASNMPMTFGNLMVTSPDSKIFKDAFSNFDDTNNTNGTDEINGLGMVFGPAIDPTMFNFDDSMSGLDTASNIMPTTESFTSTEASSSQPNMFEQAWNPAQIYGTDGTTEEHTNSQTATLPPTWTQQQLCRTDGTTIDATAPPGEKADELIYALNDTIFDRIARGEMSETEALYVMQSYTDNFKNGDE